MPYYRGEVVSDGQLQALYSAYRNCNKYADGGDSIIRDRLESAGVPINGTDQACSLGSRDEDSVRANLDANMGESQAKIAVQQAAIPGGYQSGQAPAIQTPDVVYTSTPQGQTSLLAGSPMQAPSAATSGPAGAFGYSTPGGGTIMTLGGSSPATITAPASSGIPWMLIALAAAAGLGIWWMTKGGS